MLADRIIEVTLDTNCIINAFDEGHQSATSIAQIERLLDLSKLGKVDLAVTTRVLTDLRNDPNPDRSALIIQSATAIPVIGTVGRWDVSTWGGGDIWVGQRETELIARIQAVLFPSLSKSGRHYSNKLNDIDHIAGHILSSRDVFVTDDARDILRKRETLLKEFGVVVMSPAECVRTIESKLPIQNT